eukprot:36990-Eustigmatos_ZCMA.PRE.1
MVAQDFERVHNERKQLRQELRSDMTRHQQRKYLMTTWRRNGLLLPGKSFTMLPDWQLQPVFVEYAETQLIDMFGAKMGRMELFEKKVYDLRSIRQLRKAGWRMLKFKTN